MLELGFRTCHVCRQESSYDKADAFFDTPVWADYKILDQRYPDSKFILTARDPDKWADSFISNLLHYLKGMRENNSCTVQSDSRAYQQVYGKEDICTKEYLIECYLRHRKEAEEYFKDRPGDLLIMELDSNPDPWESICSFLGLERPLVPFPRINTKSNVQEWDDISHPNKYKDMAPEWVEWAQGALRSTDNPGDVLNVLIEHKFHRKDIEQVMGCDFPKDDPRLAPPYPQ